MKRTLSFTFITISILLIAWVYYLYKPVITNEDGFTYFLRPGTSNKIFISNLQSQGIITYPPLFYMYILPQKHAQIKTGEYHFPQGSNLISIWHQVTTGTGLVYHPFTIVPGWSFNQLKQELAKRDNLRHLAEKLGDAELMQRLGGQGLPEGQFFPETYHYSRGVPDLVILKRAYDLLQSRLKTEWEDRNPNLPYKNQYEALIAASIIEKETSLDEERPLIASVLVNRLKKDMLLQVDPTVIYGLGDQYDGKIHKINLTDTNAYNTYVNKGLPPTPIAMPSISAIHAALHPDQTTYLYFVAAGNGSHHFSKTLQEHEKAVAVAKSDSWLASTHLQHYLENKLLKHSLNFIGSKHVD